MDTAKEIAQMLLEIEAVKVKIDPPFTWTSGIKSPVYCDNRKLISHPAQRKKVVDAFVAMTRALKPAPEFIGGTATAAIPWAAFLAYQLDLPMIYIRPQKKGHGEGRQVEGDLPSGKRVLIVEDLISTGGSSVSAAQVVRTECGAVVTDVFAIVTWELDEAKKAFEQAKLKLSTLTDFSHIIESAREQKSIKPQEVEKIMEFKKDPRAWRQ